MRHASQIRCLDLECGWIPRESEFSRIGENETVVRGENSPAGQSHFV